MVAAVINSIIKATRGGGDLFSLKLMVHHPTKSGKESWAGVDTEAMEESHLLACSG